MTHANTPLTLPRPSDDACPCCGAFMGVLYRRCRACGSTQPSPARARAIAEWQATPCMDDGDPQAGKALTAAERDADRLARARAGWGRAWHACSRADQKGSWAYQRVEVDGATDYTYAGPFRHGAGATRWMTLQNDQIATARIEAKIAALAAAQGPRGPQPQP